MNLFNNATILLTGADGDIGQAFIEELLDQNVRKIYITGITIN